MGVTRSFRLASGVLAGALVLGAAGTTAAEAKPPTRPGSVTVTASATEPGIGTYHVSASWTTATNATSYKASIIRAGTTVASTSQSGTTWVTDVSATPGQQLTVSVQAVAGHSKGKLSTTSLTLIDQIAPSATYTSSWDNNTGVATLTESGLKDDSPLSGVTRTVDWGDGPPTTYATGAPITHTYPLVGARYVPVVTLKDAANNPSAPVQAPAVVMEDTTPPFGATYTAGPATAWATLTRVTLTQTTAPQDNWSPAANISRSVDWGDGTTSAWTSGTTITHVYRVTTGKTYTPSVTLTDEAHNASAPITSSPVVVKVDKTAPVVKLTIPKAKHSVRAWRILRGKATDTNGTGVKRVSVRAVEQRGKAWYGYNRTTKKWVKGGTQAKAFARSRAFSLRTTSAHTWSARLVKLTKGTLVYKVTATDLVNNTSAPVSHVARLTQR